LVAVRDNTFAVTGISDGYLLDLTSGALTPHFCYEPGWMSDAPPQPDSDLVGPRSRNIAHWTREGASEIECFVAIILAITQGEIVITEEADGPFSGADAFGIVDLADEDALLDLLTQRSAAHHRAFVCGRGPVRATASSRSRRFDPMN